MNRGLVSRMRWFPAHFRYIHSLYYPSRPRGARGTVQKLLFEVVVFTTLWNPLNLQYFFEFFGVIRAMIGLEVFVTALESTLGNPWAVARARARRMKARSTRSPCTNCAGFSIPKTYTISTWTSSRPGASVWCCKKSSATLTCQNNSQNAPELFSTRKKYVKKIFSEKNDGFEPYFKVNLSPDPPERFWHRMVRPTPAL